MSDFLTTKEAGEILRLCPQSVRNLCNENKLASIRYNPNGKRLILRESLERYLASLTGGMESFTVA